MKGLSFNSYVHSGHMAPSRPNVCQLGSHLVQVALASRVKELEQDCRFYKEVNAQLDLNQAVLEKAKTAAEDESQSRSAENEARIKDLEEQVGSY